MSQVENLNCDTENQEYTFGDNVRIMKTNNQLRELHTLVRDRTTERSDFKFCADRLIRLTVEAALNELPYETCEIFTPTGQSYEGVQNRKGTVCISLMRSGEVMEKGLRECCRSIRIGKILVNEGQVIYAKLPSDVKQRYVLLTYPVITTGSTALIGIEFLLREYQCLQSNIILVCLFSTPESIELICQTYPEIKIVVSEINPIAPNHFAQKYFGRNRVLFYKIKTLVFLFKELINFSIIILRDKINTSTHIICVFFFFAFNKINLE